MNGMSLEMCTANALANRLAANVSNRTLSLSFPVICGIPYLPLPVVSLIGTTLPSFMMVVAALEKVIVGGW